MVASVAGFAGLVMSAWLIGAVMPLPPPDGGPLWEPLVFFLVLSPVPFGAFYLCAKFIWRAYRTNEIENTTPKLRPEIMTAGFKQRKYRRETATMLVSFVVCALAWWWWRTRTGTERLDRFLSYLAGVLNFPGWLVVTIFDPRESPMQPATKLTDILIPILSGLFWTLLALLLVKLWRIFRGHIHKPAKSR